MIHPCRCDSCGCYLDPGNMKQCDKCHDKDKKLARKRSEEVIKHETGTQDD